MQKKEDKKANDTQSKKEDKKSFITILKKNRAEAKAHRESDDNGRFAWARDGSLLGVFLWFLKVAMTLTFAMTLTLIVSGRLVPEVANVLYAQLISQVGDDLSTAGIAGLWGMPLLVWTLMLVFLSCCAVRMFWHWLTRWFDDVVARHKAKIEKKHSENA